MTLREIAARIDAHLKRFEAEDKVSQWRGNTSHSYYYPWAGWRGRWVHVNYVSYRRTYRLNEWDAAHYLAWLDAGNVGTHWEALRKGK